MIHRLLIVEHPTHELVDGTTKGTLWLPNHVQLWVEVGQHAQAESKKAKKNGKDPCPSADPLLLVFDLVLELDLGTKGVVVSHLLLALHKVGPFYLLVGEILMILVGF